MSTQKYKVLLRHLSSTIIVSATVVLLLGGMIYLGIKVNSSRSDLSTLKDEVADLNTKAESSITSNSLDANEVDQFTTLVSQLIPENEDFFSVLQTLENLSSQTGFVIVKYIVDPSKNVNHQLNLQVEGIGDPTAFLDFLKNYSFAGGRLVTSDSVNYNAADIGSSTIDFTFYSHKTSSFAKDNKKLSPADIQLLRQIQSKTVIIVKDTNSGSGSYSTKSNPF